MNKEIFYRKDFETFKPKYYLFCRDCIADFPQKAKKETEKRENTIIITENIKEN